MLEIGHTERIAKMIASETGGTLFEVDTLEPYPANYRETTEVAERELSSNARPAMKNAGLPDMADYDVVFIGHPIWWSEMPPVMMTFLDAVSLEGKKAAHFCTHAGSGFGRSERSLRTLEPKAEYLKSFSVYGTESAQVESAVRAWVRELNL